MSEAMMRDEGAPDRLHQEGEAILVNPFPREGVEELARVFLVPKEFPPASLVLDRPIEVRKVVPVPPSSSRLDELRTNLTHVAEETGGYRLAGLRELLAYLGHREETRGKLKTPVVALAPISEEDRRFTFAIPRANGDWVIAVIGEDKNVGMSPETLRVLREIGMAEEEPNIMRVLEALKGQSESLKYLIVKEAPIG